MRILILNGPNLNFLGIRAPEHYGRETYAALCRRIAEHCEKKRVSAEFYQSNSEGALIDRIQKAYFDGVDGIVFNPGGYTHTSIALRDALESVGIPTAEVHVSKVNEREDFRRTSYVREVCVFSVIGHGTDGYIEAIDKLSEMLG